MFPFVLFITALLFLVINTNIQLFINERNVTKLQIEQVELETLFQAARVLFQEEISHAIPLDKAKSYSLPDGEVRVNIISVNETSIRASFTIYPQSENSSYTISDTLDLE